MRRWYQSEPVRAGRSPRHTPLTLSLCAIALAVSPAAAQEANHRCQKSSFKIALDIGHDKTRPGATSARGVTEFSYNKELADDVLGALRADGFNEAFLIGESGALMPLARRPEIAREAHADLFISLHHDSAQKQFFSVWSYAGRDLPYSDLFHGYSIFVSTSSVFSRQSLELAQDLGRALRAQGLTPSAHHAQPITGENRTLLDPLLGIYAFNELMVLRGAAMPALLLESAVIVNRDEESAIRSGAYHPKVVRALVSAITRYCEHL